jgi:hypothetical protein
LKIYIYIGFYAYGWSLKFKQISAYLAIYTIKI